MRGDGALRSRWTRWARPFSCAVLLAACHRPAATDDTVPAAPAAGAGLGTASEASARPAAGDDGAAQAPATPAPSTALASDAPSSCAGWRPLACAVPPAPASALCAASTLCLEAELAADAALRGLSPGCDTDALAAGVTGPLSPADAAPQTAPVLALRLLNVVAENDVGMIQFGASFLVAERAGGACLVDRVHGWEARPSYVETTLASRWQPAAAGYRLELTSERIIHEPLDEAESASGVSDERSRVCTHLVYDVSAERFSRVEERTLVGPCRAP